MESGQRIQRNEQAVFRELAEGEGGVLLHLESGAYHGLNPIGTVIWGLVGDGSTFGDLVEGVRSRLTDAPAELVSDVAAFIEDLVERDLLIFSEE
ncbi:MAG: PqqD family protein [Acidimicrobiia bacterium]|nr:PqqD family protein [Acidimicrobiia bacterium]MDH3398472.1 PqqD family protein [Acidimicrobiia bacterium]MDH5616663.1 PqqD family protein [Acidimicrobiia bacterium]